MSTAFSLSLLSFSTHLYRFDSFLTAQFLAATCSLFTGFFEQPAVGLVGQELGNSAHFLPDRQLSCFYIICLPSTFQR
jgi:hypothetical protein